MTITLRIWASENSVLHDVICRKWVMLLAATLRSLDRKHYKNLYCFQALRALDRSHYNNLYCFPALSMFYVFFFFCPNMAHFLKFLLQNIAIAWGVTICNLDNWYIIACLRYAYNLFLIYDNALTNIMFPVNLIILMKIEINRTLRVIV